MFQFTDFFGSSEILRIFQSMSIQKRKVYFSLQRRRKKKKLIKKKGSLVSLTPSLHIQLCQIVRWMVKTLIRFVIIIQKRLFLKRQQQQQLKLTGSVPFILQLIVSSSWLEARPGHPLRLCTRGATSLQPRSPGSSLLPASYTLNRTVSRQPGRAIPVPPPGLSLTPASKLSLELNEVDGG